MTKELELAEEGLEETFDLEFERNRLKLCEKYFELERGWREDVERKAHLYFLVLIGFLGATTFKAGSLNSAIKIAFLNESPSFGTVILGIELTVMLCSIAWVIGSVFKVLEPGYYPRPYPVQLHDRLFSPFADPLPDSDEASLIKNAASRLAKVTDEFQTTNSKKSRWLVRAANGFLWVTSSSVASIVTYGLLVALD